MSSFLEIADTTIRALDPDAGQKLEGFQDWIRQTGTKLEQEARNTVINEGNSDEGLIRIINSVNPNSESSRRSQAELDYRDRFNQEVDDYVRQIELELRQATTSTDRSSQLTLTTKVGGDDGPADPLPRPRQPFGLGSSTISNQITGRANVTKEEEKINKNGLQAAQDWASGLYSGITGSEIFGEIRTGVGQLDNALTGGRIGQFIRETKEGTNLLGKAINWVTGQSTGAKIVRGIFIGGAIAAVVSAGAAVGLSLAGSALGALLSIKGLAAAGATALLWPVAKGVIRWGVSSFQRLWNFNFNASDADLKKQQEQRIVALYGIAGGALGSGLGRLICGAAGVGSVGVFNPRLAASIASIAGPDQLDEILDEMVLLLRSARSVAIAGIMTEGYQNIRSWIKGAARSEYFTRNFPKASQLIAKWGEEGGSPWSFAIATENFVESIKDKRIQNFVEEFIEEFGEGCTESLLALTVV